ncbi:FadR/GntR family transcriptional regulator [Salinactinospora qingdaonensis]|uniref:FadR/GntR family transcriptional regulator n=1 Tax=Salinactinospora qingdaonensis TaxID=702744 RepID=A0ABP7FND7_9ACTN
MAKPKGPEPIDDAPRVGTVMRAPKTAELIATHLRRQIVRGDLQPGETLPPEVQLMEQYGVSRPTLREAFRILEADTLISVRRGSRGGAQVTEPDPSVAVRYVGLLLQTRGTTVEDVYEARMAVDPVCVRLLARRRTKQDLAELRDCVDGLRRVVDDAGPGAVPAPAEWAELTHRFHRLLVQRCGNTTLAVQGEVLHDIVATHLRGRVARGVQEGESPQHFQRTVRSHRKLIDLIEARAADDAEEHWRGHMKTMAKSLFRDAPKDKPVVDLFA